MDKFKFDVHEIRACLKNNGITQAQFAKMIGLKSQGSISQIFIKGKVPVERVIQIEKVLKKYSNRFTRYEMRPDLYPRE